MAANSRKPAIAIEDCETGVAAASAAGIPVIAVPGANTQSQDFSLAAAVVDRDNAVILEHGLTLELCEDVLASPHWRAVVGVAG